ncbi:gas vesicle accessory protein GvpU [Shouchella patagoniensis]|uniref:gas vesicle accessory protein GvpU n=1 Tax=Shouchella patagoniensis TaxID=228576 RepID=UPI000994BDEA|nr:gas vesicle accessory protein GvpU [Shouchella patagoniensis]
MSASATKDSSLEFFVRAANKHDFSLDITLNVNGAMITGTTISAQEYFETLGESFEDGNEVSQKLSEEFLKAGEAAEGGGDDSINFIHLKNTKVYLAESKGTPSKGKILWRGKIEEVNGFFLGKITESKSTSSSK